MKKLLFGFLMLATAAAQAQNFEGIIKWSMKMAITDPTTKARMADAQAKMNSPENQAKMKEMQAKMNDPQIKAMMDANPQMKAQMENVLKTMSGGDPTSMIPTGFSFEVKGDNSLTRTEGGAFPVEILFLKDKNTVYMLNRPNKTYSAMPSGNNSGAQSAAPKITKTSETKKILGYNCTKYIVEVTESGRTSTQNIWTTTDIKNLDFKKFMQARMGKGQVYYEGMTGVPLRVESSAAEGNMTMEVTEIKPQALPASDFVIPSDFKETAGMFGR